MKQVAAFSPSLNAATGVTIKPPACPPAGHSDPRSIPLDFADRTNRMAGKGVSSILVPRRGGKACGSS
jgi:hypothetical protein